jgi:hypothetical protein
MDLKSKVDNIIENDTMADDVKIEKLLKMYKRLGKSEIRDYIKDTILYYKTLIRKQKLWDTLEGIVRNTSLTDEQKLNKILRYREKAIEINNKMMEINTPELSTSTKFVNKLTNIYDEKVYKARLNRFRTLRKQIHTILRYTPNNMMANKTIRGRRFTRKQINDLSRMLPNVENSDTYFEKQNMPERMLYEPLLRILGRNNNAETISRSRSKSSNSNISKGSLNSNNESIISDNI